MEDYIDINYITNLINLGYPTKSKILQLETIKSTLIILLSTNDLIIYDTKTNKSNQHCFSYPIKSIQVHRDRLYLISNTKFIVINHENFSELSSYDVKEPIYYIYFFDSQKFEMIYINNKHEIKYLTKGLLNDPTIKNLYKENSPIHKLIYQNGILLWATSFSLKVFHLEERKILIKKDFSHIKITQPILNNKVDCFLYKNILSVNVLRKEMFVFRLPDQVLQSPIEVKHLTQRNENEYYIGMWINSTLSKLSVLIYTPQGVKLEIFKVNVNKINPSLDEGYFKKEFNYIQTYSNIPNQYNDYFRFVFSKSNANVYLFNDKEIYFITIIDKSKKLFRDLQKCSLSNDNNNLLLFNDENDIEVIFDNFNSFDINEQYYILSKFILCDSSNKLNNIDDSKICSIKMSKFSFLYDTIFNQSGTNTLYNNFILLCIKYNVFSKIYADLKKHFDNYLTIQTKEKIIHILIQQYKYNLTMKFISDTSEIEITQTIEQLAGSYYKDNTNINAIFVFGFLFKKNNRLNYALKYFIRIKNSEEILSILSTPNGCDLFSNYDEIFEILSESQLLTILEKLYNKNLNLCQLFYDKLFSLCNHKRLAMFTSYLVLYDKIKLILSNNEIDEKLFSIVLQNKPNKHVQILLKLLTHYDKFDHNKLINDNKEHLLLKENVDVYIALLTQTKNYQEMINIFIDTVKDPEKCIKYIENTNIEDVAKENIYEYLKEKIANSTTLSNVKKFYFISQFQDDVTLKDPSFINLLEDMDKGNDEQSKDNVEYVLLILQELKLKLKLLGTSKDVSKEKMWDLFTERKMHLKKGKVVKFDKSNTTTSNINNSNNNKVCYNYSRCEYENCFNINNNKFDVGDDLIIFKYCKHTYHKECYNKIKTFYKECPICSQYI